VAVALVAHRDKSLALVLARVRDGEVLNGGDLLLAGLEGGGGRGDWMLAFEAELGRVAWDLPAARRAKATVNCIVKEWVGEK